MEETYSRLSFFLPEVVREKVSEIFDMTTMLRYLETTEDVKDEKEDEREVDPLTNLNLYTLHEVSYHDSYDDCWIILYDKVYDVTRFLEEHPGGHDIILEHAGRDATLAFRSVGHTKSALNALDDFLIGILCEEDRIFIVDGKCQWIQS